jgi:pimeloyl-ACP methyl ester carboxylesterase
MPEIGTRAPESWPRHASPEVVQRWAEAPLALGDGGTTRFVSLGTGPPVVCVPSLVGWKESLARVVVALSACFRASVYDLRARRLDGAPIAWEDHLADLDQVAETLAPGRVGLFGHSLGGAIALAWAVRRPERVAALVLSSTFVRARLDPAVWGKRVFEQAIVLAANRWLPDPVGLGLLRCLRDAGAWVYDRHCDESLLRLTRDGVRASRWGEVASRIRLARSFDARPLLAGVRCPVLVAVGEREPRYVRDDAKALVDGIPGAVLAVIPDGNHLHPLSRAAALASLVGGWLRERL